MSKMTTSYLLKDHETNVHEFQFNLNMNIFCRENGPEHVADYDQTYLSLCLYRGYGCNTILLIA